MRPPARRAAQRARQDEAAFSRVEDQALSQLSYSPGRNAIVAARAALRSRRTAVLRRDHRRYDRFGAREGEEIRAVRATQPRPRGAGRFSLTIVPTAERR